MKEKSESSSKTLTYESDSDQRRKEAQRSCMRSFRNLKSRVFSKSKKEEAAESEGKTEEKPEKPEEKDEEKPVEEKNEDDKYWEKVEVVEENTEEEEEKVEKEEVKGEKTEMAQPNPADVLKSD